MYPRFWLVKFYDGQQLYVTAKVIKLVSNTSNTHKIKGDENNMISLDQIDLSIKEDKEVVLTDILLSKVQKHPDFNLCSYKGICHFSSLNINC